MEYCAICENEFSKSFMKEVIYKKGIVKVCPECFRDDMPLFKKPSLDDIDSIYKRKSVYSRLSDAAGLNSSEHKNRVEGESKKNIQDDYLRNIANKNFERDAKKAKQEENLVDNFNWIIMRARRFKKLSQKQFAEQIRESESAIVLAEKGIIPAGNKLFIQKIEESLRIRILKREEERELSPFEEIQKEYIEKMKEEGDFDSFITKNVTTSDFVPSKKKWWQFRKSKPETNVEEEFLED
jgi:ribosome-binding protein aMBF1 (putative translation factor)